MKTIEVKIPDDMRRDEALGRCELELLGPLREHLSANMIELFGTRITVRVEVESLSLIPKDMRPSEAASQEPPSDGDEDGQYGDDR